MRRIIVDGDEFLWKVSGVKDPARRGWNPSQKSVRLTVRASGGSVLTVVLHSKNWDEAEHEGYDALNHCGDPDCDGCGDSYLHRAAVTPADVEKCVRAAFSEGWSSRCRRRSFELSTPPADLTDYGPAVVADTRFELVRSIMEN